MASKQLRLLRHAKSSWSDPDLDDHDRPLTRRGREAATRLGAYLRQERIRPDLVLCSSAVRARQTLELLQLPSKVEVRIEDALYGADASSLLARVRRIEDAVDSALLVGHNPGIQDFASSLASDGDELGDKFPTAAMADLRLPVTRWKDVGPGVARLREFVTAKALG